MVKDYPARKLYDITMGRIQFVENLINEHQTALDRLSDEHRHLCAMALAYEGGPNAVKPKKETPQF